MKEPNYSPVYCALYPGLAEITRKHGYALAVHGSMARDFDVVTVPWAEQVSKPDEVIKDITTQYDLKQIGDPTTKNHGRIVYTLSIGFGECFIDMSFLDNIIVTNYRECNNGK